MILKLLTYNLAALFLGYGKLYDIIDAPGYLNLIIIWFIYILQVKNTRTKNEMNLGLLMILLLSIFVDLIFATYSILIAAGYYINYLSIKRYKRPVFVVNISYYSLTRAIVDKHPKASKFDVYFTLTAILQIILTVLLNYINIKIKYIPLAPYEEWFPI